MHPASFEKMRAFRATYVTGEEERPIRVLDVGSGCGPGSLSYRELFRPPTFDYMGLDIVAGNNVDIVPDDPFCWSSIEPENFDVVVSGQMLEHNPYFWITAAEIARVLAEGGLVVAIAPSEGHSHRHPLDCWRFYPDSWSAICSYVGLELVESHREAVSWRKNIPGGIYWRDAMMVARKPRFSDDASRTAFYARIEAIVSTRTVTPDPAHSRRRDGPAGVRYEQVHTLPAVDYIAAGPWRITKLLGHRVEMIDHLHLVAAVRRRLRRRDGRISLTRGEAMMPWPSRRDGQA